MAIQDAFSNFAKNAGNFVANILGTAKTAISNVVGKTVTGFTTLWSGGFVGISESGMEEVKRGLKEYCETIDGLINGFDETGDITMAFKGDIQAAAMDYIAAMKQLLVAYVSTMKTNIEDADTAYKNYVEGAQNVAKDVRSDSEDIRKEAQSIKLD